MHFYVFCQKLPVFRGEHAEVALKNGVKNYSMQCTHVSVQVTVLGKLLFALVTVEPETLVYRKVVLLHIACLFRLVITFVTVMHWLFLVSPQKVIAQVPLASGLIIALVTNVHVMSCLVLPDSFRVLGISNFVRAYVTLEVPFVRFIPCPFS